jgi:hypothetical protein
MFSLIQYFLALTSTAVLKTLSKSALCFSIRIFAEPKLFNSNLFRIMLFQLQLFKEILSSDYFFFK